MRLKYIGCSIIIIVTIIFSMSIIVAGYFDMPLFDVNVIASDPQPH